MYTFKEWQETGKDLPDLSLERNSAGAIPLICPGRTRLNHPCEAKLFDGLKNKKTRTCLVYCQFCDFLGERILGKYTRG